MNKFLALLCFPLFLTACLEDDCNETVTYTAYHPVILSASEWRSDEFSFAPAGQVCDPSGFYVYGNVLFVLDRSKGLHIIDNTDNAAPRPLTFLNIPGGEGLAVRNNVLYVNQYVDLLAFDLSDPTEPQFLSRTENVFDPYSNFASGIMGSGDITVDYVEGTETMQLDCNSPSFQQGWARRGGVVFAMDINTANAAFSSATNNFTPTLETVGVGGSLARFTINQGTLYAVDESSLRVFALDNPAEPKFKGVNQLGWGIETIFPYKDMLFIGSMTGMHIYGVEDPLAPELYSTVEHVRNCDPVVVQNDVAYVTMWSGVDCGPGVDQLMVVDVRNPRSPKTLQEIPMSNSHGLGVDEDKLFLCAGPKGLKVLDILEDGTVGDVRTTAGDFPAKDVIVLPRQQRLIVLGWEQAGVRQYDYDAAGTPVLAGEIAICD